MGPLFLASSQGPPSPANFVCSLSPGSGGRRGTEWNRNSMWGTSPLIPTEPAFPFLLLMLLFSSCQVAGFSLQFSPLQAHVSDSRRRCALQSRGLPNLSLTHPRVSPSSSLPERSPSHVHHGPGGQNRGAVLPETHSTCTLLVTETRLGITSGFLSPNTSTSYSRVSCLLLLAAWGIGGCCQRSPSLALAVTSLFLSVGLIRELWQLMGSGRGMGTGPPGRHPPTPLTYKVLGLS